MEGSDATQEHQDEETVVGESGEDRAEKNANSQQPIGEDPGGRGTVTQSSAPPAQHQTGEVAPDQQQGPVETEQAGDGEAQGE